MSISPHLALADHADSTSQGVDLLTERILGGRRIYVAIVSVAKEILERVGHSLRSVRPPAPRWVPPPHDRSHIWRRVITPGPDRYRSNSSTTDA